jgi:hypothetical protein
MATCTAQCQTRRLSDKVMLAFHHACDQADFEVAERLLNILDTMTTAQRQARARRGSERRRNQFNVVAAHERLWQLRYPNALEEGLNLETVLTGYPYLGVCGSSLGQRAVASEASEVRRDLT